MTSGSPHRRTRIWGGIIGLTVAGVFIAANAHLVIVAVASQPECIAHAKPSTTGGGYSAAKPSC